MAEREGKQFPIYYISHAYRRFEANYSEMEKVTYAFVMASRKLKSYFQSHKIQFRTSQLLKKILEGKNESSRLADWSNQLADFGIEFEPRTAIKAQALADFIAKTTGTTPNDPNKEWKLYVDGSSTRSSSGVGIIIISLARVKMEHAVRFEFVASNNEAEYEALLLGINICCNSAARILSAYLD